MSCIGKSETFRMRLACVVATLAFGLTHASGSVTTNDVHDYTTNAFKVVLTAETNTPLVLCVGSTVFFTADGTCTTNGWGTTGTYTTVKIIDYAGLQAVGDFHVETNIAFTNAGDQVVTAEGPDDPNGTNPSCTLTFTVLKVDIAPATTNVCGAPDKYVEFVLTNSYAPSGVAWSLFPSLTNGATILTSTTNSLTVRIGNLWTNYTIRATSIDYTNCYDEAELLVKKVSMKLEIQGVPVIDPSNNYSENTTIRITAVRDADGTTITDFIDVVNIAEDATGIYTNNTTKGAHLPGAKLILASDSGTVTFVAKSLANPIDACTPPDPAKIKTTNYGVYGGTSLVVQQWFDLTNVHNLVSGNMYDWCETMVKDVLVGATGALATVLGKVSYYKKATTNDIGDAQGRIINWDHASPTAFYMNPHYEGMRLGDCKSVAIHEARHCYQDYLSSVTLWGNSDDVPAHPDNDDDQDWLVEFVLVAPTNYIVDSTNLRSSVSGPQVAFSGDATFDSYFTDPSYSHNNVIEKDAEEFVNLHAP